MRAFLLIAAALQAAAFSPPRTALSYKLWCNERISAFARGGSVAAATRDELIGEATGTAIATFGYGAVATSAIDGALTLPGVAAVWGLGVALGVLASNDLSGAHLNPAVTAALAAPQKFPVKKVAPYVARSSCAGMVASVLTSADEGPGALIAGAVDHGLPGPERGARVLHRGLDDGHPRDHGLRDGGFGATPATVLGREDWPIYRRRHGRGNDLPDVGLYDGRGLQPGARPRRGSTRDCRRRRGAFPAGWWIYSAGRIRRVLARRSVCGASGRVSCLKLRELYARVDASTSRLCLVAARDRHAADLRRLNCASVLPGRCRGRVSAFFAALGHSNRSAGLPASVKDISCTAGKRSVESAPRHLASNRVIQRCCKPKWLSKPRGARTHN